MKPPIAHGEDFPRHEPDATYESNDYAALVLLQRLVEFSLPPGYSYNGCPSSAGPLYSALTTSDAFP
jgi:hypothetical protein